MKRQLCLMLAAVLLAALSPAAVRGETAFTCSLSFEMPQQTDDAGLRALTELVSALTVRADFTEKDGAFDLDAVVGLRADRSGDAAFRLSGVPSHWSLSSPLLGETKLMFNNQAMLEFALKMQNHLELPLYRLALLYPYVWEDAFRGPAAAVTAALDVPGEDVLISAETLSALAEALSELAWDERAFSIWLTAVGLDTGLDEVITGSLGSAGFWLEEWAPGGVRVTSEGGVRRWTGVGGEETVFCRQDADGSLALSLPALLDGEDLTVSLREGSFSLQIGPSGETLSILLSADGEGNGSLSLGGSCLADTLALPRLSGGSLVLSPCGRDETRTFRLLRSDTGWDLLDEGGAPLLRVFAEITPREPESWPAWQDWQMEGVNFYSLNDETLPELIRAVLIPAVKGAVPLAAAAPVSAVTFLMDWAEETGLLAVEE